MVTGGQLEKVADEIAQNAVNCEYFMLANLAYLISGNAFANSAFFCQDLKRKKQLLLIWEKKILFFKQAF